MSGENGQVWRLRPFVGEGDYEWMAAVLTAGKEVDGISMPTSAEDFARVYRHTANLDPYEDVMLAEVAGEVVGYGRTRWWQEADGNRIYSTMAFVRPEWRRKGIGRALLQWNERRLRLIAAGHPQDGAHLLESFAENDVPGAVALLTSEGYEPARYAYRMVRPDLENIPELPLPAGLEVRPALPEHYAAIRAASLEAFRDHWGFSEENESPIEEWLESPNFDPSLWRVAWEGEEVAGMVLNFIDRAENEKNGLRRGWTEGICVRRPWRRRGLARALIALSLQALKERGMAEAALGVDAQNLSGALRLYEAMGYEVVKRSTMFRKEMGSVMRDA